MLVIFFVLMLSLIIGLGFSAMQKPRLVMADPPFAKDDLIRPKAIVAPRAYRVSVTT